MTNTPLWLLDVDGVLNALRLDDLDGYEQCDARGFRITYNPAIIRRIRDLHESGRVEVRWLTTWCDHAPIHIAPPLGLPDFKVEGAADHVDPDNVWTWWKTITAQRLSDAEPDRPLIWTDDDLSYGEKRLEVEWLRERTAPTLALSPNASTGLTASNLDRIERFIERAEQRAA